MADRIVGLDIGTFSIKAAEIEFKGTEHTLVKLGQRTLPRGAVSAGEIADVELVGSEIRALLSAAGIKTKRCVVGLGGTQVVVRSTEVPQLGDSELREALSFQVVESLPIPENELVSDFQRLAVKSDEFGNQTASVLLAGAHSDVVHRAVSAAGRGGLHVVGVDTTALGDARGLSQLLAGRFGSYAGNSTELVGEPAYDSLESPSYAVVDVGGGATTLTLVIDSLVSFVRTLPVGGDSITAKVAQIAACDLDRAEWLKRHADDHLGGGDDDVAGLVVGEIESFVTELVSEISSTLEYYLLQIGRSHLDGLWLCGGGSLVNGLSDLLGQRLGITVRRPPMEMVLREHLGDDYNDHEDALLASCGLTAVGLGLMNLQRVKGEHEINLLPHNFRSKGAQRRRVLAASMGAVVVVCGLGGLSYQRLSTESSLQNQLNQSASVLAATKAKINSYSSVAALQANATSLSAEVSNDLKGTFSWAQLLGQVAQATPSDSWITQFTGTAPTAGAPGSVTLSLTGCSQSAPKDWLTSISSVTALTDPWISSSSLVPALTGGSTCPGVPPAGSLAPQVGITTFSASATIAKDFTTSRLHFYVNSRGNS